MGSHNHHAFLGGVLWLLAAAAPVGLLSAQRARAAPSAELLLALAAAATWLLGGALLGSQAACIARGLTGYEARELRRRGAAAPPCGGATAVVARWRAALAGDAAGWRISARVRGGV